MLSNALALSLLSTGGVYLIYKKLPAKVRNFLEKHSLFTDAISFILTYMILGGTLTALIAAAMMGVMVSAMLHVVTNKDKYIYLYDLTDWLKGMTQKVQVYLEAYGEVYREKKAASVAA